MSKRTTWAGSLDELAGFLRANPQHYIEEASGWPEAVAVVLLERRRNRVASVPVGEWDPDVGPCGTCGVRHRVGACP